MSSFDPDVIKRLQRGHARANKEALRAFPPDDVMEMRLCEVKHVFIRPNKKYVFTVDPTCEACVAASRQY